MPPPTIPPQPPDPQSPPIGDPMPEPEPLPGPGEPPPPKPGDPVSTSVGLADPRDALPASVNPLPGPLQTSARGPAP